MLGRTANDLFWLSRYVERAENMARLVEVGYRIALLPRSGDPSRQEWISTLESAGCSDAYAAKYKELNTRDVINFLLFDLDNPSSVQPAPNLFIALEQQLGLRLERTQVPREYIVIDAIRRPDPN